MTSKQHLTVDADFSLSNHLWEVERAARRVVETVWGHILMADEPFIANALLSFTYPTAGKTDEEAAKRIG